MRVEGTWAASSGRQVGVYFILSNGGSADDALTGAGSPAASGAVLKDGPHPMARLPLPAGSQVSFDGSRYTLTLVGLRRRVTSGDTIHVTLTFSREPSVAFVAGVR